MEGCHFGHVNKLENKHVCPNGVWDQINWNTTKWQYTSSVTSWKNAFQALHLIAETNMQINTIAFSNEEKKRKRKAKRGLRNLWLQFDMYIYWSNVYENQLVRLYCISLFFLSTCRWVAVYDCMQLQENTKN